MWSSPVRRQTTISSKYFVIMVDVLAPTNLRRIYSTFCAVDGSKGTFQVRPHKDFIPLKGRDRLLSLRLLSQLPVHENEQETASEVGSVSEPRNAYDFMRRRREVGGDPMLQKWNASVRLANYASVENSPLCVSVSAGPFKLHVDCTKPSLAQLGRF